MHDLRYPRESRDRPSPVAYCVGGPLFAALATVLVSLWVWVVFRLFRFWDSLVGNI